MLSELQRKNVESVFNALDHDGNGLIERQDMTILSAGIIEVFELGEDSPHRAAVTATHEAWWEQIRSGADADGDGSVTRAEFTAAVDRGLLTDPGYLDVVTAAANASFDAADIDHDGFLDRTELVAVYSGAGIAAAIAYSAFNQMDTDGDGRVSRAEWQRSVHGVFTSSEPDMPGADLLGNATQPQ
ncbi:calcium binding protein CalD [Kutzneria viridogrisea]|uniref:EF-hand domain-containing protein n=2 Tax=Kutzneria TaxID=43356 RepID=W5W965_9PSEU|nr:EF-hand domain-containing protein [Kutzneria albida]AHH94724.1 hypothetical protein KALB_1351 [Kutzneria albida DSM 43870]MBA8930393.1 Ca2+-binding EF-hand superfamily protein [Kutzneria viridogrisea]